MKFFAAKNKTTQRVEGMMLEAETASDEILLTAIERLLSAGMKHPSSKINVVANDILTTWKPIDVE